MNVPYEGDSNSDPDFGVLENLITNTDLSALTAHVTREDNGKRMHEYAHFMFEASEQTEDPVSRRLWEAALVHIIDIYPLDAYPSDEQEALKATQARLESRWDFEAITENMSDVVSAGEDIAAEALQADTLNDGAYFSTGLSEAVAKQLEQTIPTLRDTLERAYENTDQRPSNIIDIIENGMEALQAAADDDVFESEDSLLNAQLILCATAVHRFTEIIITETTMANLEEIQRGIAVIAPTPLLQRRMHSCFDVYILEVVADLDVPRDAKIEAIKALASTQNTANALISGAERTTHIPFEAKDEAITTWSPIEEALIAFVRNNEDPTERLNKLLEKHTEVACAHLESCFPEGEGISSIAAENTFGDLSRMSLESLAYHADYLGLKTPLLCLIAEVADVEDHDVEEDEGIMVLYDRESTIKQMVNAYGMQLKMHIYDIINLGRKAREQAGK